MLDWPVPAEARASAGHVDLILSALTTAGFTGAIEILVNGRGISSHALSAGQNRLNLSLPLPPEALAGGRLRVSLRYAAAASESRCRDKRLGGIALSIDPRSALSLRGPEPQTTAEALALLPAEVGLAIEGGPLTAEAYRNALALAAGLAQSGHRLTLRPPATADLVLSQAAATPERRADGVLVLPLNAPAGAGARAAPPVMEDASIALATLGAETGPRETYGEAEWGFALPAAPAGKIPSALALAFIHGADAPGIHHVVHLLINGALAASAELPPGKTDPVILPIPPGLLGFADRATLRFERMTKTGCLDASAPLPVTLAPSARLLLGAAPKRARQFFEIAGATQDGLALYLPPAYFTDPGPSLPFLAALLKDYWRPGTPLALHPLSDAAAPPPHPFILVAQSAPEALSLPLRADASRILIETRDKRPVLALEREEGGFAVLARLGDHDGIWIAPPRDQNQIPNRLGLEHGDLALFDATGVALWLNTAAPRGLTLRYADATGLGDIFGKGWLFGNAALWCLATLVLLITLARRGFRR